MLLCKQARFACMVVASQASALCITQPMGFLVHSMLACADLFADVCAAIVAVPPG